MKENQVRCIGLKTHRSVYIYIRLISGSHLVLSLKSLDLYLTFTLPRFQVATPADGPVSVHIREPTTVGSRVLFMTSCRVTPFGKTQKMAYVLDFGRFVYCFEVVEFV